MAHASDFQQLDQAMRPGDGRAVLLKKGFEVLLGRLLGVKTSCIVIGLASGAFPCRRWRNHLPPFAAIQALARS